MSGLPVLYACLLFVKIKDAKQLWGLDAWKTQEEIWRDVSGRGYDKWVELDSEQSKCSFHFGNK